MFLCFSINFGQDSGSAAQPSRSDHGVHGIERLSRCPQVPADPSFKAMHTLGEKYGRSFEHSRSKARAEQVDRSQGRWGCHGRCKFAFVCNMCITLVCNLLIVLVYLHPCGILWKIAWTKSALFKDGWWSVPWNCLDRLQRPVTHCRVW